ncbi:TIR domain-containing protein [Candidatus Parcubacteria bacterium]|nr:TIR domain-containing protein [Candidatus Parcubacteria bacterium]
MHNIFISYHHANDQKYKEGLLAMNGEGINRIFIDGSVDTGDISDDFSDEEIRKKIRDEYLRDTTITIILVGLETKWRKHVDWETYSSMFDGTVNKKSGVLVIILPTADNNCFTASHADEKENIYPETHNWISIDNRIEYERRYPYLPDRIIDNLLCKNAKISVVQWNKICDDREKLKFLIEATYNDRLNCNYDMSRGLRRQNS